MNHGGNLLAFERRGRDIDHRETGTDQQHALACERARHAPRVGT
jgi:hypothetical protein